MCREFDLLALCGCECHAYSDGVRHQNGGPNGRQITQVETARTEAEGRGQGRERRRGKVQARQLHPSPAACGEGQEITCREERNPRLGISRARSGSDPAASREPHME